MRASARALRARQSEAVAAAGFLITCGFYFLGAGRSLDYDSSVTVGYFVRTPSAFDAFTRERVWNNHPLFSFLDHIVYSLGGHSETALRAIPIIAGAGTVALLAWVCARQWGFLAGAAAATVTASNPMFANLARQVRGYSLLSLAALASTIAFVALQRERTRARETTYVASLAVGIATHLYGLLVIPLHVVAVAARRELSRRWLVSWLLGTVLGLLAWAGIVGDIPSRARVFVSSFPHDLANALLGMYSHSIIATIVLIVAALAALWPLERAALAAFGVLVLMVAGIWLVVQPAFLYPRFLVWLVPGVGYLAARAVARWPVLAVLPVVCLITTIDSQGPIWTQDPLPTRQAVQIFRQVSARGERPCVLGFIGETLTAYGPPPYREVDRASQLSGCGVTLELAGVGPIAQARAVLRYHTVLPAQTPFELDSRVPLKTLLSK
jgi:hypothetical protein